VLIKKFLIYCSALSFVKSLYGISFENILFDVNSEIFSFSFLIKFWISVLNLESKSGIVFILFKLSSNKFINVIISKCLEYLLSISISKLWIYIS